MDEFYALKCVTKAQVNDSLAECPIWSLFLSLQSIDVCCIPRSYWGPLVIFGREVARFDLLTESQFDSNLFNLVIYKLEKCT